MSPALAVPVIPNDELVAIAWIGTIPGFSTQMVATQLPSDTNADGSIASWVATGFITVSVVGGDQHPDLPISRPVIQADTWSTRPGSNKPPWFMAAALATAIRYACWDRLTVSRPIPIIAQGVTYPQAVVRTAEMMTRPRRIYDDVGDYARYQMDVRLNWTVVGDRIP